MNTFKMPLFPLSNYVTLAFLVFILVVLALAKDTRVSLFVTPVWFLLLMIAYKVRHTK